MTPEQLAAIRCNASVTMDPDGFVRWWAWTFNARRKLADGYQRNHLHMVRLLAGHPHMQGIRADLMLRPDDPRVTWQLIRALCEARRAVRPSVKAHYNMGVLAYDARVEAALCGEIHIHARQRAALAVAA